MSPLVQQTHHHRSLQMNQTPLGLNCSVECTSCPDRFVWVLLAILCLIRGGSVAVAFFDVVVSMLVVMVVLDYFPHC